jgi:hypothetical protein
MGRSEDAVRSQGKERVPMMFQGMIKPIVGSHISRTPGQAKSRKKTTSEFRATGVVPGSNEVKIPIWKRRAERARIKSEIRHE